VKVTNVSGLKLKNLSLVEGGWNFIQRKNIKCCFECNYSLDLFNTQHKKKCQSECDFECSDFWVLNFTSFWNVCLLLTLYLDLQLY